MDNNEMAYPVFISFFCGKQYYYDSARLLVEDCDRLQISHDIEELIMPQDADWSLICRQKSAFYARKLEEHRKPVFWLDVDTRIRTKPQVFENATFDFAAFLRNFKYLQEYDPVQFARTFHPGFLYFNYTDSGRAFAHRIAELERTLTSNGTDDFFLQEAWQSAPSQMDITLLSPKRITKPGVENNDAWFSFGESGNVKSFVNKVEQHEASIFDKARQFRMLKTIALQDLAKNKLSSATVFLRKMIELDDSQDEIVPMLARTLKRQKMLPEALEVFDNRAKSIQNGVGKGTRYDKFLIMFFDFALDALQFTKAQEVLTELHSSGDEKTRNLARSREFRHSLETRAHAMNAKNTRTKLWWMEQPYPGNFGDIVNPYILEKLSGIPPKLVGAGNGVLAIGSVIKFAKSGTIVWGSGSPRLTDRLASDADYRAVRGPLTRRLVLDSGGNCAPVYGDPALLLPFIYRPKTKKRYELGLIRHFTHKDDKLNIDPSVKEIDIFRVGYAQIEEFLDELWECEAIISTSLHGIIVSHAYGIPAIWATFSGAEKGIPGGEVKYADYFASVGLFDQSPLDLSCMPVLKAEAVMGKATVIKCDPDYKQLLEVAPVTVTLDIRDYSRVRVVEGFR